MKKFILLQLIICFSCLCWAIPSSQSKTASCKNNISNLMPRSLSVVRDDLVRRADTKLEQDLQAIRNSPQEPLLKKQGFKPEYYRGVDQAREFNAVAEYLREIKADAKRTHIPYFSDQVEKTIVNFENSFRQHNKDNPEFLEERLKILEELKQEVRKRVKDKNVTYDWWANFNLRLSMAGSEPDFIRRILRFKNRGIINDLAESPLSRDEAGIEVAYNKELMKIIEREMNSYSQSKKRSKEFKRLKKELKGLNPEDIYTSQDLEGILFELTDFITIHTSNAVDKVLEERGWYSFDKLKTYEAMEELVSGFSKSNIRELVQNIITSLDLDELLFFRNTKEKFPEEVMFFTPDELGIMAFNTLEDKSYFVGVSGRPLTVDGEEIGTFNFFSHELTHIVVSKKGSKKNILERIGNISDKTDREKAELALFIYIHEDISDGVSLSFSLLLRDYIGTETNLSSSELRELGDIRKLSRKIMTEKEKRFFNPNDLQGLLPDSVNPNNKDEVRNFLTESGDVFADILLAP